MTEDADEYAATVFLSLTGIGKGEKRPGAYPVWPPQDSGCKSPALPKCWNDEKAKLDTVESGSGTIRITSSELNFVIKEQNYQSREIVQ